MTYKAKFEIMPKAMPDLVVMDPHQPVSDHMNRSLITSWDMSRSNRIVKEYMNSN